MRLALSLVAVAATFVTLATTATAARAHQHPRHGCRGSRTAITYYLKTARRWERQHDAPLTVPPPRPTDCRVVRRVALRVVRESWKARLAFEAWYRITYAKYSCIHRREGGWNDNTGNGYYGGLQMDWGFQTTYGAEFFARWGSAGNWPVWAQLLAAERAYHSGRGYGPWPNTGPACGA